VAHELIEDIKVYHIHSWSSSNFPIEKGYDGYTVSPVIVSTGPIEI
jgi:hypothetical protein